MTTRKDKLERLRVESPCESSWEAMQGDGRRRLCLECDKQVYDLARLTEREVAGLIEASRGDLCGRVTRDRAGRLVLQEPPEPARAAPPRIPWRASPLVTAAVAAILGLSGVEWTGEAEAVSMGSDQETEQRPGTDRPQRLGDAGAAVSGRLTTEGGDPVPGAQVMLFNLLDQQDYVGKTDDEGRFSFASLPAGIYSLNASMGEHHAASAGDFLLAGGERRQVGLTVSAGAWQAILSGEPANVSFGGAIVMSREPLRRLYDDASIVVLGVAKRSVAVHDNEYTREIRTDLVVSAVLKGQSGERVISIFHDQSLKEDADSRFPPGATVLAFLDPRDAASGWGSDGYVSADVFSGLTILPAAQADAYRRRLAALEPIARRGATRPAEMVDWLVATAEEPVTREEAVSELRNAVWVLEQQAKGNDASVDRFARDLRSVVADFLAAGGRPKGDADHLYLGAFLTEAHRERLTAALVRTAPLAAADLQLYDLVSPWHKDRLLPWLIDRLVAGEIEPGMVRQTMTKIAGELGNAELVSILAADKGSADPVAEEELRRRFVAALKR